jgi:hypothetical protein
VPWHEHPCWRLPAGKMTQLLLLCCYWKTIYQGVSNTTTIDHIHKGGYMHKSSWQWAGGCSCQLKLCLVTALASCRCACVHCTSPTPCSSQSHRPVTLLPLLQCGFVARCDNPLQMTRFQPVVVPMGGSACTPQPLFVQPFLGGMASASASANAFSNAGMAQSFADAAAQAFGAGEEC